MVAFGLKETEPEVYKMIHSQYEPFDCDQFLQFFKDELKPASSLSEYDEIFRLIDKDDSGYINTINL